MRTLASGAAVGLVVLGGVTMWGVLSPTELHCQDVRPLVQDYRTQTLSADLLARIARHLEICLDCRNYYEGRNTGPTCPPEPA